ncbi:hypothetical protein [Melissospora conviva]|uniref:hypothetical protein n=1 Tax=Melissospora conviva TaxID=3388432 RepID=UPI003C25ECCE
MSAEVWLYTLLWAVLLIAAAIAGRRLANQLTVTPLAVASTAVALTLLIGLLGGTVVEAAVATLLWGGLMVGATVLVTRLGPLPGATVAGFGGLIAVQAAVVAFVLVRFSAEEAPRAYALHWLPAVLNGAIRDVGEPAGLDESPFGAQLTAEAGLLFGILVLATGFVLAFAARRRASAFISRSAH